MTMVTGLMAVVVGGICRRIRIKALGCSGEMGQRMRNQGSKGSCARLNRHSRRI